jgi:hypothetical protein
VRRKSVGPGVASEAVDPLLLPILGAFAEDKDVTVGRVLSANGLKVGGKLFAGISKGRLLIKLPAEEVASLVASKLGASFATGGDRVMKEWVTIGVERRDAWIELARRAKRFVAGENAAMPGAASRQRLPSRRSKPSAGRG